MYRSALVLVCMVGYIAADKVLVLNSDGDWTNDIFSSDDPKPGQVSRFSLSTKEGSTIKVFCRAYGAKITPVHPCDLGKVTFNDGEMQRDYCAVKDFIFISFSNTLNIEIREGQPGGSFVDCYSRATSGDPIPEVIEFPAGSTTKTIAFPTKEGLVQDQAWILRSTGGQEISLKCTVTMKDPEDGHCRKNILTVNNGEENLTYCGTGPVNVVSVRGEIKMSAELMPSTGGKFSCTADLV